jgi:sulfate adenylyltransferase subunit 2
MELKDLENRTVYILRETCAEFSNPGILWSTGKDSTSLLWLTKKAFFGKIPFPVIHIDTGFKFKEMYEFRDRIASEWNLDLIVASNDKAKKVGMNPDMGKLRCCTELKTQALKDCLAEHNFDALILAIRRDEHGIRGKERVFSPRDKEFIWDYRNQPLEMWNYYQENIDSGEHVRVHPILQWTELDVWEYVRGENIPVNPLYFARNGKRYRSLGCKPCTNPVDSGASTVDEIISEIRITKIAERSGRAQDKEDSFTMQKLRALGYM